MAASIIKLQSNVQSDKKRRRWGTRQWAVSGGREDYTAVAAAPRRHIKWLML